MRICVAAIIDERFEDRRHRQTSPRSNFHSDLEADNTLSREKEVVLDPGDECGVEEGLQPQGKRTAAR